MTWKHHQTGRQNSRKQNVCREQAHSRDEWPAPSLIFYCKQQKYLPMYSRALRGERMGLTAMMAPRIPPLPLQPVPLLLNLTFPLLTNTERCKYNAFFCPHIPAEYLWMFCPWWVIVSMFARHDAADRLSFVVFPDRKQGTKGCIMRKHMAADRKISYSRKERKKSIAHCLFLLPELRANRMILGPKFNLQEEK